PGLRVQGRVGVGLPRLRVVVHLGLLRDPVGHRPLRPGPQVRAAEAGRPGASRGRGGGPMTVDLSRLDVPLPVVEAQTAAVATLVAAAAHSHSPSDRLAYA